MKIDEAVFIETLQKGSIYHKLGDSLLPYRTGERASSKKDFIESLCTDISSGQYFASIPRGYIVFNKHNYVPRITPILSDRDACVYYYCAKQLQDVIAINRVPGTFGGWRFGSPIREIEDKERMEDFQFSLFDDPGFESDGPYFFRNSIEPAAWKKNWVAFTQLVFDKSRQVDSAAFIKFDVANSYDTIRLDLLERKIRAEASGSHGPVIDLLFLFLRSWNRLFEEFMAKTIGIPQEETGDGSRLCANFYLQEYDAHVEAVCSELSRPGQYVRFADDQVVMAPTMRDARNVLVDASIQLHKIGLNVNSGKVIQFFRREDFDHYWTFEYFNLLEDTDDIAKVNQAARMFLEQVDLDRLTARPSPWRSHTVLARIASIGLDRIEEPTRTRIVDLLLGEDTLVGLDEWMLRKIAPALTEVERERLFNTLDNWIALSPFTGFLLNVRAACITTAR